MKLCLTSTGKDLEASVDHRFGRSRYFIFAATEGKKYRVIENSAASASQGAGIRAAQIVMDQKPEAVITGNLGPNASSVLLNAGIKVYQHGGGSVQEAIESFNKGVLKEITQATVGGHFGAGGGRGRGGRGDFSNR